MRCMSSWHSHMMKCYITMEKNKVEFFTDQQTSPGYMKGKKKVLEKYVGCYLIPIKNIFIAKI